MTVVSVLLFALWQVLIPVGIGSMFYKVHKGKIFQWVCGQMLLWAGFQIFTVLFVVLEKSFRYVMWCTLIYTAILLLLALVLFLRNGQGRIHVVHEKRLVGESHNSSDKNISVATPEAKRRILLLYVICGLLLLFQLVMTVCYAYEEGDDAFYLALSTTTANEDSMYYKNPYTGYYTGLDIRHGLAPFPMWIAFLSKVTGMVPITMAQIALPIGLILLAYGIHYLMARSLFKDNQEQGLLYFLFAEVLVLFGGYSLYSVENFLLVRISQGKAVLCNLILPFMVYLYLLLLQRWQKEKAVGKRYWLLLCCTTLAGCLCSTQGGLIVCVSAALFGLCTVLWYKRFKQFIPLGLSCCFPIGFMLLYLILG